MRGDLVKEKPNILRANFSRVSWKKLGKLTAYESELWRNAFSKIRERFALRFVEKKDRRPWADPRGAPGRRDRGGLG